MVGFTGQRMELKNILSLVSWTQDKCLIFYFVYSISESLDVSIQPGLATETRKVEETVGCGWARKISRNGDVRIHMLKEDY